MWLEERQHQFETSVRIHAALDVTLVLLCTLAQDDVVEAFLPPVTLQQQHVDHDTNNIALDRTASQLLGRPRAR
jgi:hypothetical protein